MRTSLTASARLEADFVATARLVIDLLAMSPSMRRTPTRPRFAWLLIGLAALLTSACDDYAVDLPDADDETLRALLERTQEQLVFVRGGRFIMGEQLGKLVFLDGSTGTGYNTCLMGFGAASTHPVELSSYYISAYEVTYAQQDVWAVFTDGKPVLAKLPSKHRTPDRPAGTRTWYEARAYCTWLGELTGLPFDLPTEAQWEYAARSRGRQVPYATASGRWRNPETYNNGNWRDDPFYLGDGEFSHAHPSPVTPLPVGTYPPNSLGLYDMSGNVWEWVKDWYARDYYKHSPVKNPQGPETGTKKILRGGAYTQTPYCNTVYGRYPMVPNPQGSDFFDGTVLENNGFANYGFRCVLNLQRKLKPGELVQRAIERGYLEPGPDWWPF